MIVRLRTSRETGQAFTQPVSHAYIMASKELLYLFPESGHSLFDLNIVSLCEPEEE